MGMYTELVIKADIIRDLPEDVKFVLDFLFNKDIDIDLWDKDMNIKNDVILPDHPFFKCPRWTAIGRCNSYYHIPASPSFFDGSYLFSRSDLKNYDNEIDQFLKWIDPYLDEPQGKVIGWVWYEEWDKPDLIRKIGNEWGGLDEKESK